jgi:hypothetical protein
MERHFTREDKVAQLKELERTLSNLVFHLVSTGKFKSQIPVYRNILNVCRDYIANGFEQSQLNELGRNVPDLFTRHREWNPPTDERLSGEYGKKPAKWFVNLEAVLQPMLEAADILPAIGIKL